MNRGFGEHLRISWQTLLESGPSVGFLAALMVVLGLWHLIMSWGCLRGRRSWMTGGQHVLLLLLPPGIATLAVCALPTQLPANPHTGGLLAGVSATLELVEIFSELAVAVFLPNLLLCGLAMAVTGRRHTEENEL